MIDYALNNMTVYTGIVLIAGGVIGLLAGWTIKPNATNLLAQERTMRKAAEAARDKASTRIDTLTAVCDELKLERDELLVQVGSGESYGGVPDDGKSDRIAELETDLDAAMVEVADLQARAAAAGEATASTELDGGEEQIHNGVLRRYNSILALAKWSEQNMKLWNRVVKLYEKAQHDRLSGQGPLKGYKENPGNLPKYKVGPKGNIVRDKKA